MKREILCQGEGDFLQHSKTLNEPHASVKYSELKVELLLYLAIQIVSIIKYNVCNTFSSGGVVAHRCLYTKWKWRVVALVKSL